MDRALLPLSVLTLFVANSTFTHAQSGAQKRVLWPNIASISVPKSVMLGSYEDSYYLSPIISSGESLMLAGNIYWRDRAGKTTIQQQVAAEKAYMKRSGSKLLSESYLSMGRVWTADFESIEQSGEIKFVYRSRVRISKAPKGFIESSIAGQAQAWETSVFRNVFLPTFNSLEVVGLSTPLPGGGSNTGGGSAKPDSGKLQNVSAKAVGSSVEVKGYDPVAKTWRTKSILVGGVSSASPVVDSASGVVAWVGASSVGYAVYDPARKAWVDDSMVGSGASALRVSSSGVVAWIWPSSVGYAFYDASRRTWAEDSMVGSGASGLQVSAAGAVAWIWPSAVGMAAYDPVQRAWAEESAVGSGAKNLQVNAAKTVAWVWPSAVGFAVHDPARKRWIKDLSVGSGATALKVNPSGAVSWIGFANWNYSAVYNSSSGRWSKSSSSGNGSNNGGSGTTPNPVGVKLQNVSAKAVFNGVEFTGYNPATKKWVADSMLVTSKINFLKVDPVSGVVAYATATEVGYAVYDPNASTNRWQKDWMSMRSIKHLQVGPSGVVAFFSDTEVGYAVYDPNPTVKKWDEDWMLMRQIHQMEIGPTGVVAFISNRESGYVVYDPKTRDWAEASRLLGSATDATISVAATGKVSWTYRSGGVTWSESVTYAGNGSWNFPRSE